MKVNCIGISNECEDGSSIIFLDYDSYLLRKIEAELRRFQNKYHLTNFYIFQTSKNFRWAKENGKRVKKLNFNYYAVCLLKLPYKIVVDILNASHCDKKFIRKHGHNGFPYKCDILRITPKGRTSKPVFIETVKSPYKTGEHSKIHALFLRDIFGVEINPAYIFDNSKKLNYQHYVTEAKK